MIKFPLALVSVVSISAAIAAPTLHTGTPAGFTTFMTTPSPRFGVLVNFDDPATVADTNGGSFALPGNWYSSSGIASITAVAGALVIPYGDQSAPDYLTTGSGNGTASITIDLNKATNIIGIGLADSDGVPITLIALRAGNTPLASQAVTLPTGYDPIMATTTSPIPAAIFSASRSFNRLLPTVPVWPLTICNSHPNR